MPEEKQTGLKGLVGALEAAAAKDAEKAEEGTDLIECFMCSGTGKVTAPYEYRIHLHTGFPIDVLSKLEPDQLEKYWRDMRRKDEIIMWDDGQMTEARQVSHIGITPEPVEEEEPVDEGVPEKAAGGAGEADQVAGTSAPPSVGG